MVRSFAYRTFQLRLQPQPALVLHRGRGGAPDPRRTRGRPEAERARGGVARHAVGAACGSPRRLVAALRREPRHSDRLPRRVRQGSRAGPVEPVALRFAVFQRAQLAPTQIGFKWIKLSKYRLRFAVLQRPQLPPIGPLKNPNGTSSLLLPGRSAHSRRFLFRAQQIFFSVFYCSTTFVLAPMRFFTAESRHRFGSAMKQPDMVFGYVILWVTAEEHLLRLGVDCEAGRTFSVLCTTISDIFL